jgi:hypothetical protein
MVRAWANRMGGVNPRRVSTGPTTGVNRQVLRDYARTTSGGPHSDREDGLRADGGSRRCHF